MTQPCKCGLSRPWRLFGRSDNRTQAAPRSKTGSMTPESIGLACVLSLAGFVPLGNSEIQERRENNHSTSCPGVLNAATLMVSPT